MSKPQNLGQLVESGYVVRSVKEEIRTNALSRIAAGLPLVEGVMGYGDTVLPQLENAVVAGHDIILLGERGQAKTRIIRSLVELLDEWMPVVEGSEIHDDPLAPISKYARDLVDRHGAHTRISWVHRSARYGEKLATPDTSIADLIGEVDPIKVAEGRYLSDELTLHYGLIPRTNRGVFAINELPDLAERIQVGLLNVLEERDLQIRGYAIRLPLDVMVVASANPEDYTNRGRLITPLKDRFGSQIRTHYPLDVATEVTIMGAEAAIPAVEGLDVSVPAFMSELIATISQLARSSRAISQRSGVSVRMSVTNLEVVVASAIRRAARLGEASASPRICDLDALAASISGKVEIDTFEEGRESQILETLVKSAVLLSFRERVDVAMSNRVIEEIASLDLVEIGDDLAIDAYRALVASAPALGEVAASMQPANDAELASAVEFVLEGLHLDKRLNKEAVASRAQYRVGR